MQIGIKWPDRIRGFAGACVQFVVFVQRQVNRLAVGQLRYGPPDCRKKYWTRLQMEVRAYRRTGNTEHLINIANYAWLESIEPEHPKNFFDAYVPSATRHRFEERERREGD